MTISVVIPVYNGARTIEATLDSVIRQTRPADEILLMDDGSTDDTAETLKTYLGRVTVLRQENRGVAATRNTLCAQATGDLIAFLDHDDLWHRSYLESIERLAIQYPNAVAFFTGHVNFEGYGDCQWSHDPTGTPAEAEVISGLDFLRRYNETTGSFASTSYLSLPRHVLQGLGRQPFQLDGVDDSYLCTSLPLLGAVVYAPAPLVAYRITRESQSSDRLKTFGRWVDVFRLLEERYRDEAEKPLLREFELAFASKRRQYGKLLMSAGRSPEARTQFRQAAANSMQPASIVKSLGWLIASRLPRGFHPRWPSVRREWGAPAEPQRTADESGKNA